MSVRNIASRLAALENDAIDFKIVHIINSPKAGPLAKSTNLEAESGETLAAFTSRVVANARANGQREGFIWIELAEGDGK